MGLRENFSQAVKELTGGKDDANKQPVPEKKGVKVEDLKRAVNDETSDIREDYTPFDGLEDIPVISAQGSEGYVPNDLKFGKNELAEKKAEPIFSSMDPSLRPQPSQSVQYEQPQFEQPVQPPKEQAIQSVPVIPTVPAIPAVPVMPDVPVQSVQDLQPQTQPQPQPQPQPVQQAESMQFEFEPVQPAQPIQSVSPVQPAQPVQSVPFAQSVPPIQPVQPIQPAQFTQPAPVNNMNNVNAFSAPPNQNNTQPAHPTPQSFQKAPSQNIQPVFNGNNYNGNYYNNSGVYTGNNTGGYSNYYDGKNIWDKPYYNNGQPVSAQPQGNGYSDNELTVISKNTVIDGNIRSFANMSVDGDIKGDVETTKNIDINGKIVGNITCNNAEMHTSQIQGNIRMKGNVVMERDTLLIGDLVSTYAKVNGKIKGNIDIVGKAELKGDAVIFGDISASTITVDDGAIIQGYVSTTFLNKEESRNIFPDTITIGEAAK